MLVYWNLRDFQHVKHVWVTFKSYQWKRTMFMTVERKIKDKMGRRQRPSVWLTLLRNGRREVSERSVDKKLNAVTKHSNSNDSPPTFRNCRQHKANSIPQHCTCRWKAQQVMDNRFHTPIYTNISSHSQTMLVHIVRSTLQSLLSREMKPV